MSRMSDLAIDIEIDLKQGILSYAEIADKYEVPVEWVTAIADSMIKRYWSVCNA